MAQLGSIKENINRVLTSVEGFELGLIAARHAVDDGEITIDDFEEMIHDIIFKHSGDVIAVKTRKYDNATYDDVEYKAHSRWSRGIPDSQILPSYRIRFGPQKGVYELRDTKTFHEARMSFVRWYIEFKGIFTNQTE